MLDRSVGSVADTTPGDFDRYVSTISVLDDDGTEADDGDEEYIRHSGGYAQSKWVAEKRLRNLAVEQPDLFSSVTIVRPGLVGFDTRSGSANRTDWFVRFLIGSLQIGGLRLPDPGSEGAIHVTPVDHAAAFFNCVLQRRCALFGGCPLSSAASVAVAGFVSTLHLPLTVAMPTNHFLVTFMERAADNGRLMRIMDGKEWNQTIDELPRFVFMRFLDSLGSHTSPSLQRYFFCTRSRSALSQANACESTFPVCITLRCLLGCCCCCCCCCCCSTLCPSQGECVLAVQGAVSRQRFRRYRQSQIRPHGFRVSFRLKWAVAFMFHSLLLLSCVHLSF